MKTAHSYTALVYSFIFPYGKKYRCLAVLSLLTMATNAQVADWTLCDDRDGQEYTVVHLADRWWMAENLNFNSKDSWCYKNIPENCEQYGRLYHWQQAREVCPLNWRLPKRADWQALIKVMGGASKAGKRLKTRDGWYNDGGGSDEVGFSARAGGFRDAITRSFYSIENRTGFWSDNEYDEKQAWFYSLATDSDLIDESFYLKSFGYSVRCVRD